MQLVRASSYINEGLPILKIVGRTLNLSFILHIQALILPSGKGLFSPYLILYHCKIHSIVFVLGGGSVSLTFTFITTTFEDAILYGHSSPHAWSIYVHSRFRWRDFIR